MSSADTKVTSRPLSPHLSVYHFYMTMTMSVLHRITGAGLYLGTFFVAWWLFAAATDAETFRAFNGFLGSWFGLLLLFLYTLSLVHHGLGGLRYLIMDTGRGFGLQARNSLATALPIASVGLTIVLWAIALFI